MSKPISPRVRAEELFAKTQKKTQQDQDDKNKAQRAVEKKTARLRALRLAKEAADKEAAEKADDK